MPLSSRHAAALAAVLMGAAPTFAHAEPGQIKGQDVMGDKSRSANDGWSQAPVPREQSAAKDAPDPGGDSTKMNRDRNVPDAGASCGNGTDPQQPLEHRTPYPSGHNPAQPAK